VSNAVPNRAVSDWLKARTVIIEFLKDMNVRGSKAELEHNAAALIARLSHANMTIDTADADESDPKFWTFVDHDLVHGAAAFDTLREAEADVEETTRVYGLSLEHLPYRIVRGTLVKRSNR
jgi:hypothetical protein